MNTLAGNAYFEVYPEEIQKHLIVNKKNKMWIKIPSSYFENLIISNTNITIT